MFQHVERERFGERLIRERELTQIGHEQIDLLPRLVGKERRDVDADRRRAPVTVPHQRASAPAPEIQDKVG